MANIVTAPFRSVGHSLKAGAAALSFNGKTTGRGLTLVPYYLQNLLWLLSEKYLDLARGGYGSNSAVYACVRLLSQSVPEPPLIPYVRERDGELGLPLDWSHPLRVLLRQPNELMTEYEMWELTTLYLAIGGRAIWWKERNNAGQIIGLWPIRPDRVGPIYSNSVMEGQQVIAGWSYLLPGTSTYLPLDRTDVWMTNFADPAGDSGGVVEGLGPMQVLASEVGADNAATKYVGSLLANYGQPGIVLKTQGGMNTKEDIERIKAAVSQEWGGMRRGSAAVIDAGTEIQEIGFSLKDLEFPSLRKVAESRISAAFGVPAILVGLQVGLDAGIRATIAEMREYFAETTCANYWRRYQDSFTRDVASEFSDVIICEFDTKKVKALQQLAKGEVEKIAEGFTKGAVSYNEYRDRVLGLPPIPGEPGARRVLPRGAIEIDENGDVIEAAGVPLPTSPQSTTPAAPTPAPTTALEHIDASLHVLPGASAPTKSAPALSVAVKPLPSDADRVRAAYRAYADSQDGEGALWRIVL